MIRPTTSSNDAAPVAGAWHRPQAIRRTGWALLCFAAILLVGGAYRAQSNMITSGLLFLGFGLIFAPDAVQKGWPLRLGLIILAGIGAVYTFLV